MKLKRQFMVVTGVVAALAVVLVLGYALGRFYVIDQVEKRVRDTMLVCRAFHDYVQREMHPAYYKLMEEGRLPKGFYAPEMLSSSYITRTYQRYYNEERRKIGLPEVSYKMAAVDPRNAANQANERERELIAWFNEDQDTDQLSRSGRGGRRRIFAIRSTVPLHGAALPEMSRDRGRGAGRTAQDLSMDRRVESQSRRYRGSRVYPFTSARRVRCRHGDYRWVRGPDRGGAIAADFQRPAPGAGCPADERSARE